MTRTNTAVSIPGLGDLMRGYDIFAEYASKDGEREVLFEESEIEDVTFRGDSADVTFEVLIVKWQLSMPNADLRPYLTAQAKRDIDDEQTSPREVLEKYGTHYVRSLRVGGKGSRYSSTDTTKYTQTTSLEVAAKLSYKNAAGKLSAEEEAQYRSTIEAFDTASLTRAAVQGGDSALWAHVFEGKYDEWSASVEASPVFVDFPPTNALVGVWTLASSKARQDSLKAAYDQLENEHTAVKYGDSVYLGVTGLYLDGARGDDNESVDTRAADSAHERHYRWIFAAVSGQDEFLRYGDIVTIRVEARDDRWLTGGRGEPSEHVYTKDAATDTEEATYKWKIQKDRTDVGSGPVRYEDVESTIQLQVQSCGLWLSGGRGNENKSVVTRDGESALNESTYTWSVRRKPD